ncbi:MAG: hypothetical protein OXC98_09615 [bacterium]|nr:hypothetical protein [bacterium]
MTLIFTTSAWIPTTSVLDDRGDTTTRKRCFPLTDRIAGAQL